MGVDSEYFPGPDHLPIEIVRQQAVAAAEAQLFPLYPFGYNSLRGSIDLFDDPLRKKLMSKGVVTGLTGNRDLYQMINQGWKINLDPALKDQTRLDFGSNFAPGMRKEVGILPYVNPHLRKSMANRDLSYQKAVVAEWGRTFLHDIPEVKAVVGEMTDYLELLFTTSFANLDELKDDTFAIQTRTTTFRQHSAVIGPRTPESLWVYNSETVRRRGTVDCVAVPLIVSTRWFLGESQDSRVETLQS